MCGRYSIFSPDEILEKRFGAKVQGKIFKHYNAAPSQILPVITNEKPQAIQPGIWGLRLKWLKDRPEGLINARAESVAEKPTFKHAFQKQRCLVICDGFFEWQRLKTGSQPFRIALKSNQPFAFAGLWEPYVFKDETLPSFTIITTEPNSLISKIHDRMPVILNPETEKTWLDLTSPIESLKKCLAVFPDDLLQVYPISKTVNAPTIDTVDILKPI
ncbi:MAG: SOS response-associated peptidase [Patescibacteria group bacterium]|jgi:putative SOS response-associated peptidase YedK